MATVGIVSWPLATGGLIPGNWARNGVAPCGSMTRDLTDYYNFLLARRMRRIATKSILVSESPNFAAGGDNTTFRVRAHLSPNATGVRIRNILIPTDIPGNNYVTPRGFWTITNKDTATVTYDDGTSGTNASFIYDRRITTPTSAVPDDYAVVSQDYTLSAGADHTFEFHQKDGLRSKGFSIYEILRPTLTTGTDAVIDAAKFADGQPVYDRDIADLLGDADTAWKRLGPNYISWTVAGTTAKTVTGTTETNLLDGTTTTNGWTTTSAGFYVYPQYHDSEDTRAAATYNVSCNFYCYASAAGGGTGEIRFRWGTGASDYFVKINAIGAAGWYTTTGSINGNKASDKVDLTALNTTAGTTVSVYAAGFYRRVA